MTSERLLEPMRRASRPLRRWVSRHALVWWRIRRGPSARRSQALDLEVDFWRQYLATHGSSWPDEYAFRFDAAAEVTDPALIEAVGSLPGDEVSILDVGAGPSSTVGQRFAGKTLRVTAVDPLAGEYDALLAAAGVTAPVRTQPGTGEELVEKFGRAAFDVVYARNSIDHSVDPLRIIEAMIDVAVPGGYVVLRHARNEAVTESYGQLHHWNFDERDGRLVVWRHGARPVDVTAAVAGRADVRCTVERTDYEWVVCVMRKR